MKILGLDIGSTYIKCVLLKDKKLEALEIAETSYNPLEKCYKFIQKFKPDKIVATGYGRKLIKKELKDFDIVDMTEIKAFSVGAKYIHPNTKTIIDIGGQDTKIIRLDHEGKILKFEMNDKCSAGTGKFLEIMIKTLGFSLEDINTFYEKKDFKVTELKVKINNFCTVFAESEVISLIAQGIEREEILKAIHYSITQRVVSMLKRFSIEKDVILAGGCSYNSLLRAFLENEIGMTIIIPKYSHFLGAIGAGLSGFNSD